MKSTLEKIIEFIHQIGLDIEPGEVPNTSFLPGIEAREGKIIYDVKRLAFPGDLLHEAGHLATTPRDVRGKAQGDFKGNGGDEMAAIAWSYAALQYLGLPLSVVFHEQGYKGDSLWLQQQFSEGQYIGLPMLEWRNMTNTENGKRYPQMDKWLCN